MSDARAGARHARLRLAAEDVVVELARHGDRLAFEELVRRRAGAVRGLLRRLCGNAALADDLAQETFVSAWRSLPSLQASAAIAGWLRRIAVRAWARHNARNPQRFTALEDSDTVHAGAHATDIANDAATRIDLDAALARLAPAPRACMILAYDAGMSHGEIAMATGLPLGTVKTHINRSTHALRQWLGVDEKE